MRIVRQPEVQITCEGCNAVIAVEPRDVVVNDTGCGIPYSFKCQCCNKQNAISWYGMPIPFRKLLDED